MADLSNAFGLYVLGDGEANCTSVTIISKRIAIYNDGTKCTIRNRANNYGITGNIEGTPVVATTNTEPGQSSEKVTVYATGSNYVLFPVWTSKNDQDDIIWMQSYSETGTHTVTINKSEHNNETGIYQVHIYTATSNYAPKDGIANLTITF